MADSQQDRSRLIRALLEVSKLHTLQLDPDAMLDLILEHLGEVVPYNSASILLRQGESELRIVAGRGYAESPAVLDTVFDARTLRRFHSILNNRLPVRVADVRESPDWIEIPGTEQIRAWLGVPLNSRGKIIGVLSVDRNTPNAFTEDDLKIAYTFANEVAVAIENALLSNAVEEQRQAIEHASRNESIPAEPARPKSRILKAVLESAPQNLLPSFAAPARSAPPPAGPPPPDISPPVPATTAPPPVPAAAAPPPLPAVRVEAVSSDQQLQALQGKTRRSRFPTPKPAASPRPLGAGLDLAGLGLVPPGRAPASTPTAPPLPPAPAGAASTTPGASAAASSGDLKRETLLFGKILLSNKLVKQDQLEECLRLQERIRLMGLEVRLGQLCVDRGIIDAKTLEAVLKLQKQKFAIGGDPLALRRKGLTADTDIPIGRLALDNGLLTQSQLDEAVSIQQRIRTLGVEKRLGEILVEKGFLTEDGLDGLLQVQRQRSQVLPAVAPAAPATTRPTTKLGLDDGAFAALDNDLLVRLIRPSGLLTKTQMAECERLRAELETSGVKKRVDEIAVQRGFASSEAIRKVVDMEFQKWRETAGKASPRVVAPTAAGAQKRRGMGLEMAAAALIVLGVGMGVWWQATRPSREKSTRADEMAKAKAELADFAVSPPPPDPRPREPVPPADPTVPSLVLPPEEGEPSRATFDEAAELGLAATLFSSEAARLPEMRGAVRNSPGGGAEFVAYGRGPLADETPVTLSLRFAGREVAPSESNPVFRGGYFVGRIHIGDGGRKLMAGLYTIEASIRYGGYDPTSGLQANPDLVGRGGDGNSRSRLLLRATVSVGGGENARAERATVGMLYQATAEAIEAILQRMDEQIPLFPVSGDSIDDMAAFVAQSRSQMEQDLNPVRLFQGQVAIGSAPEVEVALDAALQAVQDRLVTEAAALARRRHLPVPDEFVEGSERDRAGTVRRGRERLAELKAAIRRFEADSMLLTAARELSATVQDEADQALSEVAAFIRVRTAAAEGTGAAPRVDWITGWSERLRALALLDPELRTEMEKVKGGLQDALAQYAMLTEACGRVRISEWFVSRQLQIPPLVRTKDGRPADRLEEERAAVRSRLQKLLPPVS
ncbi:MAG: GAF domain-containing protein [Planctomycetes bacterium]|nr:GAF domain-containing protein [Planctomycetota bacterium]